MTTGKQTDMVFATLLTPNSDGKVTLDAAARTICARGTGFDVTLRYAEQGHEIE